MFIPIRLHAHDSALLPMIPLTISIAFLIINKCQVRICQLQKRGSQTSLAVYSSKPLFFNKASMLGSEPRYRIY